MAKKKKNEEVSIGALVAEYVGTFSLAFAVLASINGVLVSFIPTPVIAAFVLFIAVLSIGSISGAHINPGVTLGFLSLKKISPTSAGLYILAQIAGAMSAAAVLEQLLSGAFLSATAGEPTAQIFFAEALGMLFFGFGVAATLYNKFSSIESAAVVGGSLFLGILVASVASNGILNPAVAFAVNSVSVVYLLAPVLGAVAGMQLHSFMYRNK